MDRYNEFKERIKQESLQNRNDIDSVKASESDESDEPLCEGESNEKLQFKRFIRLQKDGLVNIREIVEKM